jgi:hypothetical protein
VGERRERERKVNADYLFRRKREERGHIQIEEK